MRQPKIKYKEYGSIWDRKRRGGVDSGGTGTKFGKYISKLDVSTNQYVINDEETKTTYKLGLGERHAFGDIHREFSSIQEWYDSLDPEIQARIVRIPLDNEMKEIKEGQ